MVYSVFDVFHVVVCNRHANLSEFIDHFLLRVLPSVSNSLITAI